MGEVHQNNRGEEVHVEIGEDVVMARTAVRREVRKTVMRTPQVLPLEVHQNNRGEDVVMARGAVRRVVRRVVKKSSPQQHHLRMGQLNKLTDYDYGFLKNRRHNKVIMTSLSIHYIHL